MQKALLEERYGGYAPFTRVERIFLLFFALLSFSGFIEFSCKASRTLWGVTL